LSVSMYENHRACMRCGKKKRDSFFFWRNIYVEMAEGAILKGGIQVPLEMHPKVLYSNKSI